MRLAIAGLTTLVLTGTTLTSLPANAQSSAAAAESLYQEGQRLMASGNVHDACIKFGQSQKLEPATGTLLNLASCHEKEGKTASAWAEFNEAIAGTVRAGQKDREAYARSHAVALEKQLRRMVVEVPQPPPGTEVQLDGESLGSVALGAAIPVDPGEHEITVSAPKKKTWSQKVKFEPGPGNTRVPVPPLEDPNAATQPANVFPKGEESTPSPAQSNTRSTVGYVVGGAGILALGTGIFFGLRAKSYGDKADREQNKALDYNAEGRRTNAEIQHDAAMDDHDKAKTSQTIALVAGATGMVAIGVGVYLVVTGKERKESTARVTPLLSPNTAGASASFQF
ncbi:PEGA domain-containing protein [Pendulispora rubella]|uniref:PEGA domain-containing protein n=1 Tax=Pendulispora rubella TaxID=2741070 RepID=A0ABZ2KTR0_9BACT